MFVLLGVLALMALLFWRFSSGARAGRERPVFRERPVPPRQMVEALVHALISDRGFLRADTRIRSAEEREITIERDGACGCLVLRPLHAPIGDSDLAPPVPQFTPSNATTLVLVGGDTSAGRTERASIRGHVLHVSDAGAVSEHGRGFGSGAPRLVLENALDRAASDLAQGGLPVIDFETARSLIWHGGPVVQSRAALRGVATTALTVAMAICFVIEALISPDALRGEGASLSVVYRMGGIHQPTILEGEWQRLLAAPFLHFGLLHLGMNAWAQWSLGSPIEYLIGSWRFLLLWVVSGLGASVTSLVVNDASISAGASGAIFGLLGAFTTFVFFRKDVLPQPVPRALRNGVLLTLLLNVLISFIPSIDMAAHAGGFVTGALLSLGTVRREPSVRAPRKSLLLLAVAGLVLAGVGFTSFIRRADRVIQVPAIEGEHYVGDLRLPIPKGFAVTEERQGDVTIVTAEGAPGSPFSVALKVSDQQESEASARALLPAFREKDDAAEATDWLAISRMGVSGNRAVEVIVVAPSSCRTQADELGARLAKLIP